MSKPRLWPHSSPQEQLGSLNLSSCTDKPHKIQVSTSILKGMKEFLILFIFNSIISINLSINIWLFPLLHPAVSGSLSWASSKCSKKIAIEAPNFLIVVPGWRVWNRIFAGVQISLWYHQILCPEATLPPGGFSMEKIPGLCSKRGQGKRPEQLILVFLSKNSWILGSWTQWRLKENWFYWGKVWWRLWTTLRIKTSAAALLVQGWWCWTSEWGFLREIPLKVP